ncbi:MAG: TetR/AcrR family transcriptional regulator [Verrucomicrobia bacterium]|nr:TetR/AcrR family transcriptional regulator [Cytophagales bacterium]
MPVKKVTRDEVVLKALGVFHQLGYHHTTMQDLADSCGLLKGSFYHYFDSKESLMLEVLTGIGEYMHAKVFVIAYNDNLSGKEKLEKMFVKLEKILRYNEEGGCILGNMTLETARIIPEFAVILKAIFLEWAAALKYIFQEKYAAVDAERLAWETLTAFEGAVMMAKLFDKPDFYQDCYRKTLQIFN